MGHNFPSLVILFTGFVDQTVTFQVSSSKGNFTGLLSSPNMRFESIKKWKLELYSLWNSLAGLLIQMQTKTSVEH